MHKSFCHLPLWHNVAFPLSSPKSRRSIGTRRKRDAAEGWQKKKKGSAVSINGGLVWKKKGLGDLFGSVWHLECINKQLFTLYKRQEGRVGAIQVLYEALWHSAEYGETRDKATRVQCDRRGSAATDKRALGACFFCALERVKFVRLQKLCYDKKKNQLRKENFFKCKSVFNLITAAEKLRDKKCRRRGVQRVAKHITFETPPVLPLNKLIVKGMFRRMMHVHDAD